MSIILSFKKKNNYIKLSHNSYSKKYNLNIVEEDIILPDIYSNVKYIKPLKKIFLIKKYLEIYDNILWLDDNMFITKYCPMLFKNDKILCHNYGKLNYINESLFIKNILNLNINRDYIIDTSIILIPKILRKYLTDKYINEKIKYFNYEFGDKLLFNDIIHNNNLECEYLNYSSNALLSIENVENQDDINLFKDKLTTDINKCNNEVKKFNIFNLNNFKNRYIFNIVVEKLYNYYYENNSIVLKKIIGITINNQFNDIYSCGINLNVYFWYDFIKLCGYEPVLITYDTDIDNIDIFDNRYNIVDSKNIYSFAIFNDLFLYLNIGLSINFLINYLKNSIKIINIILGSLYYNDILNIVGNNCIRTSEVITIYDEIWISPHFEFSIEYLKCRYMTDKIFICPYFWEPYNLKNLNILEFNKNNINVGIIESNINLYKHCIIPIMIAEKGNKVINSIQVYNSYNIKENDFFKTLMMNTKLFKNKKISFEKRFQINSIFKNFCNCVISYTQDCDLNYLFFECFYLGIPLIHNSYMLKDYGYYYEKMNIEEGSKHIENIFNNFNKDKYIEKNKNILKKYSIYNENYKKWFINKIK